MKTSLSAPVTASYEGIVVGYAPPVTPCGIITPETQLQTGVRSDGRSIRLFFGEQTEDFSNVFDIQPSSSLRVEGYHKYIVTPRGEEYFDDRTLFVTRVDILS